MSAHDLDLASVMAELEHHRRVKRIEEETKKAVEEVPTILTEMEVALLVKKIRREVILEIAQAMPAVPLLKKPNDWAAGRIQGIADCLQALRSIDREG